VTLVAGHDDSERTFPRIQLLSIALIGNENDLVGEA